MNFDEFLDEDKAEAETKEETEGLTIQVIGYIDGLGNGLKRVNFLKAWELRQIGLVAFIWNTFL